MRCCLLFSNKITTVTHQELESCFQMIKPECMINANAKMASAISTNRQGKDRILALYISDNKHFKIKSSTGVIKNRNGVL